MTKKYYYDCSIQVLYMHINFGVKFNTEVKLIADLTTDPNDYKIMTPEITKIYVLPESEHIFQLKNDDFGIVKNFTLYEDIIFVRFSGYYNSWKYENDEYEERFNNDEVNIIHRDGKLFFNPKEEN